MEVWFYPDNQKRAARCTQLITMIKTIVADVREKSAYGKDFTALIIQNIEDTLKKENKYSVQDLVNGVNTEWGPEVQKGYENMVKSAEEASEFLKPEATIFAFVASTASSVSLGAFAVDIFTYGTGIVQCKLVTQALVCFASNKFTSGLQLLKYCKNLSRISRFKAPVGLKILKFLKWGGGALSFVSVLIEFGLGIYAAFAGAENRAALQTAIKDLCTRRFIVKCIQSLHDIYRDSLQGMYTFVTKTKSYQRRLRNDEINQDFYNKRMKDTVTKTVRIIKQKTEKLKFDTIWDNLWELDENDYAYRADDLEKKEMMDSLEVSDILACLDKDVEKTLEKKAHEKSVSFDPMDSLPDANDVDNFAAALSEQKAEDGKATEMITENANDSDLSDASDGKRGSGQRSRRMTLTKIASDQENAK
ncbi:hypothetical protein BDV29DRAFT_183229 [Aspergillus leporis]|uniref:Uncharacterized protein n=1 Tax=Aspergillus leporis TaxID=41062 RepID=A0A5N5WPR3_9EURO|nr:hypothetical protein BDV29DRAFT_183229 [Aspergillus leporis]